MLSDMRQSALCRGLFDRRDTDGEVGAQARWLVVEFDFASRLLVDQPVEQQGAKALVLRR